MNDDEIRKKMDMKNELEAYFELNKNDDNAKKLLYCEIPEY